MTKRDEPPSTYRRGTWCKSCHGVAGAYFIGIDRFEGICPLCNGEASERLAQNIQTVKAAEDFL